ncbi:MAG: hypothetical protein LBR79_05290 [Oscillospiraceae bacterium]|jgi:hypothetical protein|nr:hypothetical protein [Oscillospiraceae bacterium]
MKNRIISGLLAALAIFTSLVGEQAGCCIPPKSETSKIQKIKNFVSDNPAKCTLVAMGVSLLTVFTVLYCKKRYAEEPQPTNIYAERPVLSYVIDALKRRYDTVFKGANDYLDNLPENDGELTGEMIDEADKQRNALYDIELALHEGMSLKFDKLAQRWPGTTPRPAWEEEAGEKKEIDAERPVLSHTIDVLKRRYDTVFKGANDYLDSLPENDGELTGEMIDEAGKQWNALYDAEVELDDGMELKFDKLAQRWEGKKSMEIIENVLN